MNNKARSKQSEETKPNGKVSILLSVPALRAPDSNQEGFRADNLNPPIVPQRPQIHQENPKMLQDSSDSSLNKEDDVLSDREVANMVFKDDLKPSSFRSIQKLAREGVIKGVLVGGKWRFHREAVRDFLMGHK